MTTTIEAEFARFQKFNAIKHAAFRQVPSGMTRDEWVAEVSRCMLVLLIDEVDEQTWWRVVDRAVSLALIK